MKPEKSKFVTSLVISNEIRTQYSYNPSESANSHTTYIKHFSHFYDC